MFLSDCWLNNARLSMIVRPPYALLSLSSELSSSMLKFDCYGGNAMICGEAWCSIVAPNFYCCSEVANRIDEMSN